MIKSKKIISCLLSVCTLLGSVSMLSGCNKEDNGKVSITIGNWPLETSTVFAKYDALKKKYQELYPDVEFKTDSGDSSFKTFTTLGIAGQLPGYLRLPFTEADKVAESGYVLDLTEELDKRGYLSAMNSQLRDLLTADDGNIYCLPLDSYKLGLCINKKLFEAAGLVNEDGTVKYPETYTELAEYAKIIKEKTGKAGFILSTKNNHGGWLFMPIAWSNGVEFVKNDGSKWTATFDTPEMVKALQYVYDLKWKYNAIQDNQLMDIAESEKLFASGEGAMYIAAPPEQALAKTYGMNPNDICWGALPSGDAGRYTLLGGAIGVMNANYNEEQVDALFKWLDVCGTTPEVNERMIENLESAFEVQKADGQIIPPYALFDLWTNKERTQKEQEIRSKYANVEKENFVHYIETEDITLRAEEPVACQELYAILDSGIQAILSDQNIDLTALAKKMNEQFQKDCLDGLEE